MRSLRLSIGFCFITGLFSTATAQDQGTTIFKDSSWSSVELRRDSSDGFERIVQITKTSSYHIVDAWDGKENQRLLIHELATERTWSGLDGSFGEIVLTACSETDNYTEPVWTETVDANATDYEYEHLRLTQYGCCGAENGHTLLRYTDGKKLLDLSSALARVEIPNQHSERYIGFLSDNTEIARDTLSTFVGLLTYVDPRSLKREQAAFYTKKNNDNSYFTDIALTSTHPKVKGHNGKSLSVWSATHPADYSGFTIDVIFEGDKGEVIRIPVRNDALDLSAVRSDKIMIVRR